MALAKKRRSSFFVKPASWETLLRRTSMSLRISGFLNRAKNSSADFLVNPMVNIFIGPSDSKRTHDFALLHSVLRTRSSRLELYSPLKTGRLCLSVRGSPLFQEFEEGASY